MATIFSEDFETDGNGSRYTTSDPESVSTGSSDYFGRASAETISSSYDVTGQSGDFYFGTYDTDAVAASSTVSVTFTGIDVSGFNDLEVSALFAEDDDGGNQDWDVNSAVYLEVQIDGGGWMRVLQFSSGGATNTEPGLDLDFDGVADGAALTDSFASFSASVAGTGALMDIRVTFENLDANDEDIAFDLLEVSGTAGVTSVNVLIENFNDGSGFTTNTGFFSDGSGDYFGITDGVTGDFGGDALPSNDKSYSGATGSYLTGQDLDGEGATLPVVAEWTGLDITGLQNLQFSGDFGEAFDSPGDIDTNDFIRVQYRIDGGEYVTLLDFRGADFTSTNGISNGNFRLDTDGDGLGDGALLSDALSNFSSQIDATGTTLDLRLEVAVGAGDEDFAVDNFRIIGEGNGEPTPAIVVNADDGVSVEEEGSSTDSFTLSLGTTPTADVAVEIAADAQTEISLDGTTYGATVTASLDGSGSAEIFVRAIDDAIDEANPHSGSLSFTVTSTDPDYDGLEVAPLNVNIGDNDFVVTLIHDIQGSGDASTMVGQEVTVEAVVTGLFTNASGQTGYYLQEEDADADADAATSEGIFVFSNQPVEVGQRIRITAEVAEFSDLTELTNVSEVEVLETGVTLPTAVQITLGLSDSFEAYESMRVQLVSNGDDPLTVITNFNLDRFGEVVVAEGNQTQPGMLFDAQTELAEIEALTQANLANRITIDDASSQQNPDVYRLIDAGDGTPLEAGDPITSDGQTLRLGAEIDNAIGITGILDERFGGYRLQSDGPLAVTPESNAGARPDEAPDVGGELKVASFNVLNYFTTFSGGTGPNGDISPRGADNQEEFDRQTQKIVNALVALDADIVGLQELENNGFGEGSAIEALVDALNAELGADIYAYVDSYGADFIGTDAITTGLIYKIDSVSVAGASFIQFEEASADATFAIAEQLNPFASSDDRVQDFDRNRPTVAATFEDASGKQITVAVSHFKSKGDSNLEDLYFDALNAGAPQELLDALLADPNYDQGDAQGFWAAARDDAAQELADWIATNPTGATNSEGNLLLGDLNSYAKEDAVQSLEGDGYTNLADAYLGDEAYGFVFDGQRGTLDYGLADGDLLDNVTGVAEWHINADEPDLLNYDTDFNNPDFFDGDSFYGASDHDPLVIGIDLSDPEVETAEVNIDFVETHGHHGWGWGHFFGWGQNGRNKTEAIYSIDGEIQGSQHVSAFSHKFSFWQAGISLTARDDDHHFTRLTGVDGSLGVRSGGWRGRDQESDLVDSGESLTFRLFDREGLGDATEVNFVFDRIEGDGDITMAFYSDGVLVDEALVSISDGSAGYDLDGNESFDKVILSTTDDLGVSLDDVTFLRIEEDTFQIA